MYSEAKKRKDMEAMEAMRVENERKDVTTASFLLNPPLL